MDSFLHLIIFPSGSPMPVARSLSLRRRRRFCPISLIGATGLDL